MWFLFSCPESCRDILQEECKNKIPQEQLSNIFYLTCDQVRRYEGSWHLERKNLLPGYLICETSQPEELEKALKTLVEDLKIKTDARFIPVTHTDEVFLQQLYDGNRHLNMSRGVIQNGKTIIQEGPLQGLEEKIIKIDRHKRIAFLKSSDQTKEALLFKVGLEITEKTTA